MKRMMAALLLASASTVAQAQWTNQARTVDSYTWGTPVPQQQRHLRPRPAYSNPPPAYMNAQPVPQGAIDGTTGQYLPPAAGGAINPQTGAFYLSVGGGYINTQTGQFMPAN